MAASLFERVGGNEWFTALVERFYEGVEPDAGLRRLYPADLVPGKRRLSAFLAQYFGGPPTYFAMRGEPRLRMRHLRFEIGPAERDSWLCHMTAAVRSGGLDAAAEREMLEYFAATAGMLMNGGGSGGSPAGEGTRLRILPVPGSGNA